MAGAKPTRIKTITDMHTRLCLPKPRHELISVISVDKIITPPGAYVFDFYIISLLRNSCHDFKYGQHNYICNDGQLYFIAPGQVFERSNEYVSREPLRGMSIYIHPDLLWGSLLAQSIKNFAYFGYSVYEALTLTETEDAIIVGILQNIQAEYSTRIDKHTKDIIIPQIEVLLNYAERFYQRQFLASKKEHHLVLSRMEDVLTAYFNSDELPDKGLPSVPYIAEQLNISTNYLSALLKALTNRNALQHIQDRMIEKAKEKITFTDLRVNEIAYELGFGYPQSFSRLFKAKTGLSPIAFRQKLNEKDSPIDIDSRLFSNLISTERLQTDNG